MQNSGRVRGSIALAQKAASAGDERSIEPLGRISSAKIAECRSVSTEWSFHLPHQEQPYTHWWVKMEENADGWTDLEVRRQHDERDPKPTIALKVGVMNGEILALARALTAMSERLSQNEDDSWKDMPELVV